MIRGGTGAGTINQVYGDAAFLDASREGEKITAGRDVIHGGEGAHNTLRGDAYFANRLGLFGTMGDAAGNVILGNDVLIGGNNIASSEDNPFGNIMIGDVEGAGFGVTFGNDRLISGTFADDQMWGDAIEYEGSGPKGADVFVFATNNGQDVIMDFEVGHDKIDLDAFDIMSWADMQTRLSDDGLGNTLIDLGDGNNVMLEGVDYTTLTSNDFVLG